MANFPYRLFNIPLDPSVVSGPVTAVASEAVVTAYINLRLENSFFFILYVYFYGIEFIE
jgi:hypothetical protein